MWNSQLACIAICIACLLTTLMSLHLVSTTLRHNSNTTALTVPDTWSPQDIIKPLWTTEQLEPRFAYAQYTTDLDYLCNAAINFARLYRFGTKHDMILIYPMQWSNGESKEAVVLRRFHASYPYVQLRPFDILSTSKGDVTWRNSLTKFNAFALIDYTRILVFDSDSLVLNNMDHYFFAPQTPLAVPRAYWLSKSENGIAHHILGSHVMLLEPKQQMLDKIMLEAKISGDFDMDVVNHLFNMSAMILPHRRLALLSGEFRTTDHRRYLGMEEGEEEWNAMAEMSRAVLVHFSDWPLPKPWKPRSRSQWESALPACDANEREKPDRPRCADRTMWVGLYTDYDLEKEQHCKLINS